MCATSSFSLFFILSVTDNSGKAWHGKLTLSSALPCLLTILCNHARAVCISMSVHNELTDPRNAMSQALVKYLDNVSDEDIPSLEIPTGVPLIYELDDNLKPIRHYYVG